MIRKWTSPLEQMLISDSQENITVEKLTKQKLALKNELIYVNPEDCSLWKFKDRPMNELGDINELAEDLKQNGQIQPCIARTLDNGKYEIIAGERRLRAALSAGLKLAIIIKSFTDSEAALVQASENDKRQDLSDYAKALSYKKLIDNQLITSADIEKKLHKSRSYIRNLFSFTKFLPEITQAIGDLSKISSRTAYELYCLQEKGEIYVEAILSIASKLRTGDIGCKKLNKLINQTISGHYTQKIEKETIKTLSGHTLFISKRTVKGNRVINFTNQLSQKVDFVKIEEVLVKEIERQLSEKLY